MASNHQPRKHDTKVPVLDPVSKIKKKQKRKWETIKKKYHGD
jgi:hypothetical protein